ncbi:AAA family ATPase [Streptomyces goshikiensis]|uniref:helix-turn-helix transcriptional regulator n=1 Tax=Streptomyces goshikiensis TaxID=1942 RepID=UPI00381A8CBC
MGTAYGKQSASTGHDEYGGPGLVGRQRELLLLERALDGARSGTGGSAVVLRGEPGIGKTALLDWASARAFGHGFTVLRAVGVEAEVASAFGVLDQVLRPLLAGSGALPGSQRVALEYALGLRDGLPPGGFMVGAAALALLAEEARRRPLLILVDDLHCVDPSSKAVLAFLHQRIGDLPLVMLSTTRPDGSALEGWPTHPVDVEALSGTDARALLRQWHPELAATTAERVVDEAAGNPLALAELPRQLRQEHQRGIAPLPERLPLGERLERLFTERLRSLSAEPMRVLLLTALGGDEAAGQGGGWWRAAGGDGAELVLDRIEASGLARLDHAGRLVFRHPLVRSAVIAAASEAERRAAHRTLAGYAPEGDARRLLHEASAAESPGEPLAARLQEAGSRLALRGADAEGALLLDRAAALSTDAGNRARRLTLAAVMSARGGRLPYTARLVEELKQGPVPADIAPLFAYAVVYVDQSHHMDFESSFTLLPRALAGLTATAARPFGDDLAEQAFFKLLLATVYTGDPRGRRALEAHLEHVSPAARLCHRAWADPPRTAHGVESELRAMVTRMTNDQDTGKSWLLLWTASAVDAADCGLWRLFAGQHAFATQGSVAKASAYRHFLRGRWDTAQECLREADAAAEAGYHSNALLFRHYYAHFLAGRGDEQGLRDVRARIEPAAAAARMRFVTDQLTHLDALAALAHGRHEEAYGRLRRLMAPGELPSGLPWFHLPFFDFVLAAVRCGRGEEAVAHVAAGRAARMDEISGHHAFLLAAADALAAGAEEEDAEEAEARFAAAYAVPGADRWVFDLARLRLAHGSRLRRRGRRAEADDVLRAAYHAFLDLRADPWAEQCREELRAAGRAVDGAAGGGAAAGEPLTPQELRIARLVATGLTNKEIGVELRLSPRTVAAHLYKVFPKLGITSRAAVARALGGLPEV